MGTAHQWPCPQREATLGARCPPFGSFTVLCKGLPGQPLFDNTNLHRTGDDRCRFATRTYEGERFPKRQPVSHLTAASYPDYTQIGVSETTTSCRKRTYDEPGTSIRRRHQRTLNGIIRRNFRLSNGFRQHREFVSGQNMPPKNCHEQRKSFPDKLLR